MHLDIFFEQRYDVVENVSKEIQKNNKQIFYKLCYDKTKRNNNKSHCHHDKVRTMYFQYKK